MVPHPSLSWSCSAASRDRRPISTPWSTSTSAIRRLWCAAPSWTPPSRALAATISLSFRMQINELKLYDLIGEEGFDRLVRAFYAQVPGDDILGAMYPAHDMTGA